MNGNNETKDVEQTPNEQGEKLSFQEYMKREGLQLEAAKERDAQIKEALSDLSTRIGCGHEGLKREHAAILKCLTQTNARIQGIETIVNAIDTWLNGLDSPPEKPEPQPETVEQPALEEPDEQGKTVPPDGSGL